MICFDEIASPEDARAYIRQALELTDEYVRELARAGMIDAYGGAQGTRWIFFTSYIARAAGLTEEDLDRLRDRLAAAEAGAA